MEDAYAKLLKKALQSKNKPTNINKNEKPTHLDLFSGIGGFSLASEAAGFQTVGFCEREKFCRKVLQKYWPSVPIHSDIRELDGTSYRGVSLVTGGFPCQPFSVAGKQRGKEDHRYLWPEMLRIIAQARPAWVLGENVAGIIGLALDQVLFDLEAQGYTTRAFVIPACAVQAPHRRDRVWIISRHTNSQIHGEKQEISGKSQNTQSGRVRQNVSHSHGIRQQRRLKRAQKSQRTGKALAQIVSESFPRDYLSAPRICRSSDGIPCWMDRLKALGNAIVPQVAYRILKGILETGDINSFSLWSDSQ